MQQLRLADFKKVRHNNQPPTTKNYQPITRNQPATANKQQPITPNT